MNRVYISVINDLVTDQRVHRVADLITGLGMEPFCIGRRLRNSPDLQNMGFRSRRFRMGWTKGPLFYAFFNVRLLAYLLFAPRPSLIISNDLDTLPASFTAARLRRVPLVYDSHEFFTEVPELIGRKLTRGIWKQIERFYVPRVKWALAVSPSIARIYKNLYRTPFAVVRNVPNKLDARSVAKLRGEQKAANNRFRVIYQGALNVGRGIELMIETMKYLDHITFLIAGSGDIEARLKGQVAELGLGDRVRFLGRLSPEELLVHTCTSDLGVSMEEDLGLNYRYALPNKIFDYIQGRIPVLTSALPEMKRVVETFGIGISTQERDPVKLASIVRYMCEEQAAGAWSDALDRAADQLCWEKESGKYVDLLKNALTN